MTEFKGIAYEPHPVTPERKAELRAQGLQIIDIAFKPADAANEHEVLPGFDANAAQVPTRRRGKSDKE